MSEEEGQIEDSESQDDSRSEKTCGQGLWQKKDFRNWEKKCRSEKTPWSGAMTEEKKLGKKMSEEEGQIEDSESQDSRNSRVKRHWTHMQNRRSETERNWDKKCRKGKVR